MAKERVILRRAAGYDPALIRSIITEGLKDLGLEGKASGRITIKPNVVMAHRTVAPSAYTRPEFLEGLIQSIPDQPGGRKRITIAEKCGAGLPTSRMLRRAGYYKLRRKTGVKVKPIEESPKKTVTLKKGKLHSSITTSPDITDADFLIYAPKLKSNVLAQGVTAAIKLNMGILRDLQRMWNHNYLLDDKIVDLLEVGRPDFIATDAIEVAVGGNQLTEHGRELGVIIMAANPVAHDTVCAHILNLDPEKINHIRMAHERGYGPCRLEDISLTGDITLTELQAKTEGWDLGYCRVDDLECNMDIRAGEPYCTGGCHGVFLDWLYMIKDRKPSLWAKLPRWTVVIGQYQGDVEARKVMILGRCSRVQGRLKARVKRKIGRCPPKHKDIVLGFFIHGGILNPMFRLDLIYDAYVCLFFSWCRRLLTGRL